MNNYLCIPLLSAFLIVPVSIVSAQATSDSPGNEAFLHSSSTTVTNVLPAEALGPDDLLEIMIPYCPELSRSFRVSSDGNLMLPLLKKQISVAGLTPIQVSTRIVEELKSEQVLADPIVNVSVLEYRSRPVSVVGAVNRPLTFQATGATTLLEAIAKAGGLSPNVGAEILVTRKIKSADGTIESKVQTIPVKSLVETADPQYNLTMQGGEEIRVPESSKIFVTGNVRRPGMYSMQADSDTTVLKALALSSGLDSYSAKRAYIYRRHAGTENRDELEIPLSQIMMRKSPDVKLMADDVLYIPENNGKRLTSRVLTQITGFGQTTVSGMMIYR